MAQTHRDGTERAAIGGLQGSPPAAGRVRGHVLVADDDADLGTAVRLLLTEEDFAVTVTVSPAEALAAVRAESFDAALIDLNYTRDTTSGREGLTLLELIRDADPELPVAVMTAWSSVASAVAAMRLGAQEYVEKPWNDEQLLDLVATMTAARRGRRAARAVAEGDKTVGMDHKPPGAEQPVLVGESPAMRAVVDLIERIAPSDAAVLITGGHGTGKELAARLVHTRSARARRPLVTINAGGLSTGVAESELFGHVRGAFTDARADRVGCFELANGGTLFLDEIGNMPLELQAKLLRVLQTGEFQRVGSSTVSRVDVRIVAATNIDLRGEVRAGRFREDLLYRLNTVELRLPTLAQRGRDDVLLLANHFLAQCAARYARNVRDFAPDAIEALVSQTWPGNVRELAHSVERGVLLARGEHVRARDLDAGSWSAWDPQPAVVDATDLSLDAVERAHIRRVLSDTGGDVEAAARILGLSRSALYRRLRHLD